MSVTGMATDADTSATSSAGTVSDYRDGLWNNYGVGTFGAYFSLASVLQIGSSAETSSQSAVESTSISGSNGTATAIETVTAARGNSSRLYEAGIYVRS